MSEEVARLMAESEQVLADAMSLKAKAAAVLAAYRLDAAIWMAVDGRIPNDVFQSLGIKPNKGVK